MGKQFAFFFATVLFVIAFPREARAQWLDGKVAVRTNGNNFQSGDQLKVELLPLDLINERFYTQVTYRFLQLSSDKLDGLAGQTLDILVLDRYNGVSSTLSRVTIASGK